MKPKISRHDSVRAVPCETARVFTRGGANGNWLGVVPEGNYPAAVMQAVAHKLGFSETAFVFPPDSKRADYRVRFFTPEKEIPFAGHPTLGTLHVLLATKRLPIKRRYVQQIGDRLVALETMPDGRIRMDQGKPAFSGTIPRASAAALVGLDEVAGEPRVVSTGMPHLLIPLRGMAQLRKAAIAPSAYARMAKKTGAWCVMPFCVSRGGVHCRMFAPGLGIAEDPATGSGCGPLASYLVRYRLVPGGNRGVAEIAITQGIQKPSQLFAWVHHAYGTVTRVVVGGYSVLGRRRTVAP